MPVANTVTEQLLALAKDCYTLDQAINLLDSPGVEDARIGVVDVDGVIREKKVAPSKAQKLLKQGYMFCDVLYNWDIAENTYGNGDFSDAEAAIDPASVRVNPFQPGSLYFLADFSDDLGAKSPRNIALQQIARAKDLGFTVNAAFEFEFFVFNETAQTLRQKSYRNLESYLPGNWTYSALSSVIGAEFLDGLQTVMSTAAVPIDVLHTELGPGCFEAALGVGQGIHCADDAIFFKTFTKAYAAKGDRTATFMSKWSNDYPGQSGHLHVSLRDTKTNEPVFNCSEQNSEPNDVMRHFVGGVVQYMPELLAMTAHTANAYRRLVPGAWAPTHACWGIQNRSASVRLIPKPHDATRIEYRVPSADTNPYLAFAACLASGLDGIEKKIEPPAMSIGDAYNDSISPDRVFPRTLTEAADRLYSSSNARRLFGDSFVDWFADSRLREDTVFRAHVSDLDVQRYLEKI